MTAHPGAPNLPTPRRSSAEVAEGCRLKALENKAEAVSTAALAKTILELQAKNLELEKQVLIASAPFKARCERQASATI